MPPGFTGDLSGISYCSDAAILAAARKAGPCRAGRAELSGVELRRDLERRRRPGIAPLPRGRQDVSGGPVERRPALAGRDHPGAGRALRLRERRRAGRAARRSADRSGDRGLRHAAADHRRRRDPDAIDRGQHRPAELHDQPDELRTAHGRLPGNRRPGHGHRLHLLFPGGELRDSRLQAEDERQADRQAQGHQAQQEPETAVSSSGPGRATRTSSHSR